MECGRIAESRIASLAAKGRDRFRMLDHSNRWLLGFAAAYLILLPTNSATFPGSIAFAGAGLLAVAVVALAARDPLRRVHFAGAAVLVPLFAWALWSMASLVWSLHPEYTWEALRRDVVYGLAAMLIFYVAGRDMRGLRMLVAAVLASFAFYALLALYMGIRDGTWNASLHHQGVGPYSTWLVLVAPFLFTLIAPRPAGLRNGAATTAIGIGLFALLIVTAKMTDNRIVWVALATVFGVASLAAAWRWPQSLRRAPLRWVLPLCAILIVLGIAFADALKERVAADYPRGTSIAAAIEHDPRVMLWPRTLQMIRARPWTGYGFGRHIVAQELVTELRDPLLTHAHNIFAGQLMQTGIVGLAAFVAFIGALFARYARFLRSRDDTLAFVGLVGISLLAGFIVKNLTDDFLFGDTAKELWALTAFLLGCGVSRERMLTEGRLPAAAIDDIAILRPGRPRRPAAAKPTPLRDSRAQKAVRVSDAAAPAAAPPLRPRRRQSESA